MSGEGYSPPTDRPIWEWTWDEVQGFLAYGWRVTLSEKFWDDNPQLPRPHLEADAKRPRRSEA